MTTILPPTDLSNWIKEKLFHAVPMGIAVIDPDFNVVYANEAFQNMFGDWHHRKCYDVYKDRDSICLTCKGAEAFQDGLPRINEESGYNKEGKFTRYIKHTVPVADESGSIPYLIEMCTDITETEQIRREYELLFDHIPCNILLIDRDFRIVKTNRHMRQLLGNIASQHCYQGLKGFDHQCSECTARQTFQDGKQHTGHHVWTTRTGETVHLYVITLPIRMENGHFDLVMEMAVDITQTVKLEEGIQYAHSFLKTIISTSMDGIFAVDESGDVTLMNPSAMHIFKIPEDRSVSRRDLEAMLPEKILECVPGGGKYTHTPETVIANMEGEEIPVRLVGNQLIIGDTYQGMAFSIQDLSEIKRLERGKLEAERLAAVGQTVAGLAHGVKNLINALEGGMYMLSTGIGKGNIDRVQKGVDMLSRNIDRISVFVKAFLGFSKGREIHVEQNKPEAIANEVVEIYATKAQQYGIELASDYKDLLDPAPIDYESMLECLTNLVGNAIDACRVSDSGKGSKVTIRIREEKGIIIYEVVDDGCGMDYDVKKKVFTTFFTTKGLGGTGLGLLMTKKIVQEHGGTIDVTTVPGKGTTFRIKLPRSRLPKLITDQT
ncbi:MAG: PAS domain-containing protein [Deltaproteobacteria bacterium]|nr:PAS domain-containing protein [Deltaproteobacteria bacterium]